MNERSDTLNVMRPALAFVTLLAACGGGTGVDIKINVEDGVQFDAVELYIAYDHCKKPDGADCPGVGWPGVSADPAPGKVFELTDKLRVRSDVLKDGNGVLHLEAAPGFADPVAIGVAALSGPPGQETVVGAWVIHDMHIPGNNEQTWQFTLKKTSAASVDLAAPANGIDYRATVWARETAPMPPEPNATLADYAGCAAFQAWDGNAWTTEYFVPADDTDCDGVPADCNPLWNHAPVGTQKCISLDTEFAAPVPCTLGALRCTDESPGTCSPLAPAQCIPEALCTMCKGSDPKSCIRDAVNKDSPSGIPSYTCQFMVDSSASTRVGCDALANGETLNFVVPIPCALMGTVAAAALRPYDNIFAPNAGFVMLDNSKITVHAQAYSTTQCALSLNWGHGMPAPSNDQPVFVAVNTTMGRQIVFPVWLSFETGDCTTPPVGCQVGSVPWPDGVGPADSMMACAR